MSTPDRTHGTDGRDESTTTISRRTVLAALGAGGVAGLSGPVAGAAPDPDDSGPADGGGRVGDLRGRGAPDPSTPLLASTVVSDGPDARVTRNLAVAGRGERLLPNGTTDVWTHGRFAYLGTFQTPCGTGEGYREGAGPVELVDDRLAPGIAIFDVRNPTDPSYVGNLPSVAGSRTNDVKVAAMNAGDVLVHSNEACELGGPGGFELYAVDDPTAPEHLAHVQTDDINALLREDLGFVDFGVHNLFLFTQGERDYVAAVVESEFGNFQVFDITEPTDPTLVGAWGAERLLLPGVDWFTTTDFANHILPADAYLFSGHGSSANRFLHDVTVGADGTRAYLANWDAGLVLLDIADPSEPSLVSVAIDPTAGDGEVNSHAAWPSADGTVVVETEEDFDVTAFTFTVDGDPFPAVEGAFTTPILDLPGQTMAGPTVYVGLACDAGTVPAAPSGDHLAVAQRGACRFDTKASNVIDAGYAGMVVFNHAAGGDEVITMGGEARDLPGVFVGHSTGLEIFDAADAGALTVGETGDPVAASVALEPGDRWGNVRIWDYSDEANPVLASEFDTVCSANPGHPGCGPEETFSVHNVIVEDDAAYLSWYADGVLVLDISDPTEPVETARFSRDDAAFVVQNGGPQDVWGIDKEPGRPWIYASDRNGGLYVLKEYGQGSSKRGQ